MYFGQNHPYVSYVYLNLPQFYPCLTVFNNDSSILHPLTASCGDQLRHHPIHDAARVGAAAPGGRQRVQLVEEEDAGRQVPGVLEERPAILRYTRGSHEKTGGKTGGNIKIFKNGMVTMRKWLVHKNGFEVSKMRFAPSK